MKPREYCIPFVGAIIERMHEGERQVLIQTRNHTDTDSIYNGTVEFAAGTMDKLYENTFDVLAREVLEETGLTLKRVINDDRTEVFRPQGVDAVFGFRPFCCVQQLEEGRPWVGFIFRCEVEDGEPTGQAGESENVHWTGATVVKEMLEKTPEKLFTLEVPAWHYYFQAVESE